MNLNANIKLADFKTVSSHLTLPWRWTECLEGSACPQLAHLPIKDSTVNDLPREWVEQMMNVSNYMFESEALDEMLKLFNHEHIPIGINSNEVLSNGKIARIAKEKLTKILRDKNDVYNKSYLENLEKLPFSRSLVVLNSQHEYHNEDGPAVEQADGTLRWYQNGLLHRADGPAIEYVDGTKKWFFRNKLHCSTGPAVEYSYGGKEWHVNGKRHNDNGPAVQYADGTSQWWLNGELHREDGPAMEWPDGSTEWWLNGIVHREDGPAVERADGKKEWRRHGELHRVDGPAVEYPNGVCRWFINGEQIDKTDNNHTSNESQS